MTLVADENRGRPWRRCEMQAGRYSRWLRNAPASRMRRLPLFVGRAGESFLLSTRISATSFSTEGFQREVESTGPSPNLPTKWQTPPWHYFSLIPISAGLFASSHGIGVRPMRPDSILSGRGRGVQMEAKTSIRKSFVSLGLPARTPPPSNRMCGSIRSLGFGLRVSAPRVEVSGCWLLTPISRRDPDEALAGQY